MTSSTRIQSVLVSRRAYPRLDDAVAVVQAMGHITPKVDATPNYYRFRQFDPTRAPKRTRDAAHGVKYIVEF